MSATATFAGACLVAFGGGMGYMKKKSVASLTAGVTFGLAYAVSGYWQGSPETVQRGHGLGVATSLLLGVSMLMRWSKLDFKFPSVPGIVFVIAAVVGGFNLLPFIS